VPRLTFVQDFSLALGGELLIALGMGVGNAAVFKMVPKYVPQAVGGAAGLVGGLGALGGFIIPPFLGAVVDALGTQGYAGGFFAYVVLAVMARPRRRRRWCGRRRGRAQRVSATGSSTTRGIERSAVSGANFAPSRCRLFLKGNREIFQEKQGGD
jgi:nitrate/nitrite transporter NarK